jgi:hypothetical protein
MAKVGEFGAFFFNSTVKLGRKTIMAAIRATEI